MFLKNCLLGYTYSHCTGLIYMAKQNSSPLSLEETLMDNPAIEWLMQNRRKIGYSALIVVLALILLYRLFAYRTEQTELEFTQAAKAFNQLNDPQKLESSLYDLELILARYPELQAKYDGAIAQRLLNADEVPLAIPYAERALNRVSGETTPPYLDYSKTTLLIAQGKLEEALKQAYALKNSMLQTINAHTAPDFGGTLYAFNLIRTALLEREFGHKAEERKGWDELNDMMKGTHPVKISALDWQRVVSHFEDQGANLNEFIETKPAP